MVVLAPVPGLRIVKAPRVGRSVPVRLRSLSELADAGVHPRVVDAVRDISARLQREGVRHAVVGALAVGVCGWPRATRDVELLVEECVGLPEEVGGVGIEYLPLDVAGEFLSVAFERPLLSEGVPIAPPEVVACTKLLRLAMRDQADLVEMIKAGVVDVGVIRAFLVAHTPMLVGRWDALIEQAARER